MDLWQIVLLSGLALCIASAYLIYDRDSPYWIVGWSIGVVMELIGALLRAAGS